MAEACGSYVTRLEGLRLENSAMGAIHLCAGVSVDWSPGVYLLKGIHLTGGHGWCLTPTHRGPKHPSHIHFPATLRSEPTSYFGYLSREAYLPRGISSITQHHPLQSGSSHSDFLTLVSDKQQKDDSQGEQPPSPQINPMTVLS